MKLVVLASFILLLSWKPLSAQNNYAIKGSVLDTASSTGLQNASIAVLNSKDSTLVRFTRADANGGFSLNNLREGNFILLLTYPDFADYVETFSLSADKPLKDFGKLKMILKARLLAEVIVKGTAAQMTIKGDRLICFSKGFQHITQLNKGFHLIYNMMGLC